MHDSYCSSNSGVELDRIPDGNGGHMLSDGAVSMFAGVHIISYTNCTVLREAERAETMSVWVHQEPKLEILCYVS